MTMISSRFMRTIRNRPMLASCGAMAAALAAVQPSPAFSQAYEGAPIVVSGGATIDRGTPGVDTINVNSEQVVIDWNPFDTAVNGADIDFLPNGTTASYQGGIGVANFTVLNRIIANDPTRAIILNGNIISQLQTSPGVFAPGGAVWFYAPGGIVIGSTATIDVGGLFLTASDPVRDGAGNFIDGSGTTTFQQASILTAGVRIDSGATINLTPENSYIGIFAPIVQQSGNVTVNGSAAYIAAEAGSITFNQGLFDINVTVGTDGDNPNNIAISHNGTTTGPASSGAGDNHRIYMVAIPKNNAITIAIENSGDLGFDIAGAADVVGNSIILSAGYNVAGDSFAADPVPTNGNVGNISLSGVDITSSLASRATGGVSIATFAGNVTAASNVDLHGDANASLISNVVGNSIDIAGDLRLSADNIANGIGENATAGEVNVFIDGGAINIGGNAIFSANAQGGNNFTGAGSVGSGQGGNVIFNINNGGNLDVANDVIIEADGSAGAGATGASSASGTGGNLQLSVSGSGSTLDVGGNFIASVSGFGGDDLDGSGNNTGTGGAINVAINDSGNSLNVIGDLTFGAFGRGGDANVGNIGGNAQGGDIVVSVGQNSILNVDGNFNIDSSATGGNIVGTGVGAGIGGDALGGNSILQISGLSGSIDIAGTVDIFAGAFGGSTQVLGIGVDSGTGGNAQGGSAGISIGNSGTFVAGGTADISTVAQGGDGSSAGSATGGNSTIDINNFSAATFQSDVILGSNAIAGGNQTGTGTTGNAQGGTAQIVATANGNLTVLGNADLFAIGGAGAVNGVLTSAGIDGGDGTGGTISISQGTNGTITINGTADLSADGFGGENRGGGDGIAGIGQGGDARIAVNSAGVNAGDISLFIAGQANVQANGIGGDVDGGIRAGDGIGGLANIGSAVGRLVVGGNALVSANGLGGNALSDGSGGDGIGGQALIGTVTSGALIEFNGGITEILAIGTGGLGAGIGDIGGNGVGGMAQVFADPGGTITSLNTFTLDASGLGGGGLAGANGGDAAGSFAAITVAGDGIINVGGGVQLTANATGGASAGGESGNATAGIARLNTDGAVSAINVAGIASLNAFARTLDADGDAGDATGGSTEIVLNNGGTISLASIVLMNANAQAGNSLIDGNGGTATAGNGLIGAFGVDAGAITIGNIIASANAIAGNAGNASIGDGGNGGSATAGSFNLQFSTADTLSTIDVGNIDISLNAFAGNGGAGNFGGGAGGNGGEASGGNISILGQAARGALTTGNINIAGEILAGRGGNGGDSDAGAGGNGGSGGNALGAGITIGTSSGDVTAQTLGSGTFGNISIMSTSIGGNGGNGGFSLTGGANGNGGNGGSATGSDATLLVRGSPVITGDIDFTFQTIGGDGGFGTVRGNGGDATGDAQEILVSNRFMLTDPGDLTTGNIVFNNSASAGGGAVNGQSISGSAVINLTQSTATIGSFTANVTGGFLDPVTNPSFISAVDSTLNIIGNLSLSTEGHVGIITDSGDIMVGGDLDLFATTFVANVTGTDPLNPGTLTVNGQASFVSPQDVILSTNLVTPNGVDISVVGDLFLLNVTSGGAIALSTDVGDLRTGDLSGDDGVTLLTNIGFIETGMINALNGSIDLNTNDGPITTGDLSSSDNIFVNADSGNIALGLISGMNTVTVTAATGGITTGDIALADTIIVNASGDVITGTADAITLLSIVSQNGSLTVGDLTSDTGIDLSAINDLTTGNLTTTAGSIALNSDVGSITTGNISSAGDITIDAQLNASVGNLDAIGEVSIDTGGNAATGTIQASTIFADAAGSLSVGDIISTGTPGPDGNFGTGLLAGAGLTTGNIISAGRIGLLTNGGDIITGNLSTASDLLILAAGGVTTGDIITSVDPSGFIFIGDISMVALGGPEFDPALIFAADPVLISGPITINGTVSGGNFLAGTSSSFASSGSINLTGLFQLDAGGLASFGGAVSAPSIFITSGDIDIGINGGLGDENTDEISLRSNTAGGTVIGDIGNTSGDYVLDNAEAGRLRGANIAISSLNAGGITIGNLDLVGGDGTNANLIGANGILTIDSADTLRVIGTVNITDMAATNILGLSAERVEIATDTGSIILEGNSLGGILSLSGRNIHVGSTTLLDQLAIDPFFEGRNALLARPTPGPNADGTIQAGRIELSAQETLLIQNSGTADMVGGFFANTGQVIITPTGSAGALLDMVIHGSTLNADGTLTTNEDVRDAIFADTPAGFTEGSSVNGCALNAESCAIAPEGGEEEVVATTVRDTANDAQAQDTPAAEEEAAEAESEEEPLTEEEEEKAEEKATRSSPIARPVSLINTRPITSSGPIEEPVTSGGNPNLMGAPVSSQIGDRIEGSQP